MIDRRGIGEMGEKTGEKMGEKMERKVVKATDGLFLEYRALR